MSVCSALAMLLRDSDLLAHPLMLQHKILRSLTLIGLRPLGITTLEMILLLLLLLVVGFWVKLV